MTCTRTIMLIAAIGLAGWYIAGSQGKAQRTLADLAKRDIPKSPEDLRSDTHRFELPGPNGRRVMAYFHGLNRLPPSGDDLCAALRMELDTNPPKLDVDLSSLPREEAERIQRETTQLIRTGFEQQWRMGCMPGYRIKLRSVPAQKQRVATLGLAQSLTAYRTGPTDADEGRDALIIRWAIIQMKGISRVEDLRPFLVSACHVRPSAEPMSLAARRFMADCKRLQAAICDPAALASCRAEALIDAGKEFSMLGRLESNERHFRDMASVLDEAEPLARAVAERDTRTRLLAEMAAAFGYAGEAGRDVSLLRRAVEIAQRNLAERKPGPGDVEREEYAEALDDLATALSRLAPTEPDRISATRRAIEVFERAIAFRASVMSDDPSWAVHVNLASDQRYLFELTRERRSIDDAINNARRSLAIISLRAGRGSKNDNQLSYVRARLGEALAWRSKYAEDMEPAAREAGFIEAKEHLATAEAMFRRMNTKAYLSFINAAQLLLPEEMRPRER